MRYGCQELLRVHTLKQPQTRSFAAVLFRRIASKTRKNPANNDLSELFLSLGQEQRAAIRQKILACFPNEQLQPVRNKIGDAIAELARQYTDNSMFGPWDRPLTQ